MSFDIEGARKAGYSDAEIAAHLGKQSGFDVDGARQSGYSDSEILAHLSQPKAQPAPQQAQDERSGLRSAAEGVFRSAASVGNTLLTPVKAGARAVGADGVADYLERIPEAMKWMDQENASNPVSYGAGRVVGDIAMTAPVGGLVGSGIKTVGAKAGLPMLERLGTAAATGGFSTGAAAPRTMAARAGDLGVRATGGAVTGAASTGLIDPQQAGSGAVAGAAFPVGVSAIRGTLGATGRAAGGVRRAVEPLNPRNDARLVGQVLRQQAGADADTAIRALEDHIRTGPAIPGYQPTAAEVARVPSLAAMQRTATAVDPLAMNKHGQMTARNQDALMSQLEELAGDDGRRVFTESMRTEAGNRLYETAFNKPLRPITKPMQFTIDSLTRRPAVQEAMRRARVLAANEGLDMTDPAGSLRGLHYTKTEIDGMIAEARTANEKRILMGVKDQLVRVLDKMSPDYARARAEFEAMSRPVDRLKVLEKVRDRSTTPRGDITLGKFNTAASDRTARGATGNMRATMADVLEADQLKKLGDIRFTLEGLDFAQTAGRGVGSDTVQKLATAGRLPGGGGLRIPGGGPLTGLLNRGLDALYSNANKRLQERLSLSLLDPAETLGLLNAAPPLGLPTGGLLSSPRTQGLLSGAYRAAPVLLTQ